MHITDKTRTYLNKNCPICEKEFNQRPSGRPETCSLSCARKLQWQRSGKANPEVRPAPSGYLWQILPEDSDHPYGVYLGNKKNKTRRMYQLQHRYVMEQMLGRYLEPTEYVHHKNGDRTDNRPENLELWASNRKDPPGQRVSDLVNTAREKLSFLEDKEQRERAIDVFKELLGIEQLDL